MKIKEVVKSFFKVFISFSCFYIILFLFNRVVYSYVNYSFTNSKYGITLVAEMMAFFFLFLFLILIGKRNIFTEKRESFFKSIALGIPVLIFTAVLLIAGVGTILQEGHLHLPNFITVFFLCLFIGLFEESLCRGWLLNSFLDKLGKNRKGVLLSIVLSGFLFGCLHLTNILAGQSFFLTLIQVAQTFMIGMVLGIIYFRTKNIWSVAFLHAFYDFAAFLSDVNALKDCQFVSTLPSSYYIYMVCSTLVICTFYFLSFFLLARKTKVNALVEEKEELLPEDVAKDERKKLLCCISMIAVWFLQSLVPVHFEMDEIEVCYTYEEKEKLQHVASFYTLDTYSLEYSFYSEIEPNPSFQDLFHSSNYSISYYFSLEEGTLQIIRQDTLEKKEIDHNILQYILYEDETRYVLYYLKNVDEDSTLYYVSILKKDLNSDYDLFAYLEHHTFTSYVLPDVAKIGTYQEKNNEYVYPYAVTFANDAFIITEENHLYVLKK